VATTKRPDADHATIGAIGYPSFQTFDHVELLTATKTVKPSQQRRYVD
jgi:hypothetical protein